MSTTAKPWEVDAQERSRRARNLFVQAALWAPSMAERDIIIEALHPPYPLLENLKTTTVVHSLETLEDR